MKVEISGSFRAIPILVIVQEAVPVEVFNNLIVGYRFEEFADDTKVTSRSIFRQA